MPILVLDCSLAVSWFFADEAEPADYAILERLALGQAVVPALWPYEVTNALVVAERKKRISSADASQIIIQLKRLPVKVEATANKETWEVLLVLAQEYHLSTYDAAYAECALRHKLPLATKDKQLAKATRDLGIEVLP